MSTDQATVADTAPITGTAPNAGSAPITDPAVRPPFHLAVPVDDLAQAAAFYGGVLGLPRGRSSDHWIDWNLGGHQVVTHLAPGPRPDRAHNPVDGHDVPVPHFGLVLPIADFQQLAGRLRGWHRGPGGQVKGEPARRLTPGDPQRGIAAGEVAA